MLGNWQPCYEFKHEVAIWTINWSLNSSLEMCAYHDAFDMLSLFTLTMMDKTKDNKLWHWCSGEIGESDNCTRRPFIWNHPLVELVFIRVICSFWRRITQHFRNISLYQIWIISRKLKDSGNCLGPRTSAFVACLVCVSIYFRDSLTSNRCFTKERLLTTVMWLMFARGSRLFVSNFTKGLDPMIS